MSHVHPIAWLAMPAALLLAGCASTVIDGNFSSTRSLARQGLGAEVEWLRDADAGRQARAEVDALLAGPLAADDAVRVALAHSPSLQAMLFESAANSAGVTQSARLPNPVLTFEHLLRSDASAGDLEINRTLSVSIVDLLLLPSRIRLAGHRQETVRLQQAGHVVRAATEARQAWVAAVAAEQSARYAEQVKATADASAEIARRMQSVGNYSKLQRAREQAFSADAVAGLARARQTALSSREALVRALGLDEAQARSMKLPDRLPDLPSSPKDEAFVTRRALDQRLDVRLGRSNLDFVAREQGLTRVTSLVNGLEVGIERNSETGRPTQGGYVLQLPLPLFDFGDAARARAEATYMAAFNRAAQIGIDAASQVREAYGAYRTAYALSTHYRDEIVPLRKTISEENMLRYNGMLIGVFELLADARAQIGSVMLAIDAQRDFWLADAALQATLLGSPIAMEMRSSAPSLSDASQ